MIGIIYRITINDIIYEKKEINKKNRMKTKYEK